MSMSPVPKRIHEKVDPANVTKGALLTLRVRVPEKRDHAAAVEVLPARAGVAKGLAAASSSRELAAHHGNAVLDPMRPWGPPASGGYLLLAQGPAPAGCESEYGSHLLVFQPISGQALEAESFGRLLLLVYAGPPARSGALRPTQGGLRLQQETLDKLVALLKGDTQCALEISGERRSWWEFWKRPLATPALAAEVPHFSTPPLDEASLATELAAGKRLDIARLRRSSRERERDTDDDWRDNASSSSSSSGGSGGYSGGGGQYGGAGASGSWDTRGVDASGRISTAAAGAALAAGAVAGAAAAEAAGTETSTSY